MLQVHCAACTEILNFEAQIAMIHERGKLRHAIYCCLLAFLLQNSLALPVIETPESARPEQQQQRRECLTAQANPDSIRPTPEHIVELLGPGQVEDFVLPLPLKARTDQQMRPVRDVSREDVTSVLCRGEWPFPPEAVTQLRAVYFMEWQSERREYHAVS